MACSCWAPMQPTLLGHRAPQEVRKYEVVTWTCLEASETSLLKEVTDYMAVVILTYTQVRDETNQSGPAFWNCVPTPSA